MFFFGSTSLSSCFVHTQYYKTTYTCNKIPSTPHHHTPPLPIMSIGRHYVLLVSQRGSNRRASRRSHRPRNNNDADEQFHHILQTQHPITAVMFAFRRRGLSVRIDSARNRVSSERRLAFYIRVFMQFHTTGGNTLGDLMAAARYTAREQNLVLTINRASIQ